MLLLDEQTRFIFAAYLRERRVLLRGRPAGIDPTAWRGWLDQTRGGIEYEEVAILARAYGPSIYQAIGRPDLAETKKLKLPN